MYKSPETLTWLFLEDGIDVSRSADNMEAAVKARVLGEIFLGKTFSMSFNSNVKPQNA